MPAQGSVHNGQRAPHQTLGTRTRCRGRADAARSEPASHACAPRNRRASVWHAEDADGGDALFDERQIEKRRKRCKCGYADKWASCQKLGVRACRPVEHPCWNLQPSICSRSIQRAAESDIISLVDRSMNANSATKPRMISIKNLAKNGPVGVLNPCCTIRNAGIRQSDI